jgi:membrane-bound serine protease (ClpP class)
MPVELLVGGLIIIGFLLILIEIFLVPGFNIFGVFGFIMVALGIIFAYTKLSLATANFIMVLSLISALILVRVVVKSKTWRRIVLNDKQEKAEGFHASAENLTRLIAKKGTAYTPLRPAGIALIEDQKVDVMTEGGFVERNRTIEVVLVEGNRVVVREIV